jgi:hydroxymethylpyrimidine kinase / phosphomethylpyrimidine kinase / thiamine-phosphate diphosphorylase
VNRPHPHDPQAAAPAGDAPPTVWTFGRADPRSCTGAQGDLRALFDLGVHGCSVITACGSADPAAIRAQRDTLPSSPPPRAVKTGLPRNEAAARALADALPDEPVFVVCDPADPADVTPIDPATLACFRDRILPRVDLLVVDRVAAEALGAPPAADPADAPGTARALRAGGAAAVYIKGVARVGAFFQDYWQDSHTAGWLTAPHLDTPSVHGAGCALSAAIAAAAARGHTVSDALVIARAYVQQGLLSSPTGSGAPADIRLRGWPNRPAALPWMTATADAGLADWAFPACPHLPIGVYPVVDSLDWVIRLLRAGVRTIQLRIKTPPTAEVVEEIRSAIRRAREYGAELYINDYWEIAVQEGAYGVHLGQEDFSVDALRAVAAAGCRLGLSASSYADLARAWTYRPSYIGLGAVFATPSKEVDYPPLQVEGFAALRALTPAVAVAIGGITHENAAPLIRAGADGLAVISNITQAPDLAARLRQLRALF